MNIEIRPATAEDRNALWQVHTQAIRQSAKSHYDAAQIEAWAGRLTPEGYRPPDTYVIAEAEDGSVVGFGELNLQATEIKAVFVDPKFGRRGIGSHLLKALEDLAKRQGLTTLVLDASLNAVKFYERAGYRQAEPTVCVYGRDAVAVPGMLMMKSLFQSEVTGVEVIGDANGDGS